LDKKQYRIAGGELGFHAGIRNKLGLDVVIFDRTLLTPYQITPRYVSVAPQVVIEVDVNVELPEKNSDLFQEYVIRKVESLFAHGVEKVIWFFTKSKKVFIALPNQAWQIDDWNKDVDLFQGVTVNVAAYIAQEGFELE
jgi:Uma2 family endonuclease